MKKQKKILISILLPFLLLSAYGGDSVPLRVVRTIPLPDVAGRIDHMDIDREGRLFVAALGNNSMEVIDPAKGSRVGSIVGLNEPQGVLVVPEKKLLFITNGGDGTVRVYDTESLAPIKTIKFSSDADNIRYDRAGGQVYVGYGEGLGIVDVRSLKRTGDVPLSGHPESFQFEKNGKRIFLNIPSAGEIAVVDKRRKSVLAHWPVPGNCKNFPMALDEAGKRLFVGCRNPEKMIVYDIETGKAVSEIKIAGDVDDIFFDGLRKRIYASCGAGFLQVFDVKEDTYPLLTNIPTMHGARTSLFVPEQGLLYLAIPAEKKRQAEILIFSVPP